MAAAQPSGQKQPSMASDEQDVRCLYIKRNILHLIACGAPEEAIAAEIMQTQRCRQEQAGKLAVVRAAYAEKLGRDLTAKLESTQVQPLSIDESAAVMYTVNHYRKWTRDEVVAALPVTAWLSFQFEEHVHKFAAALGIFTGAAAVSKRIPRWTAMRKRSQD